MPGHDDHATDVRVARRKKMQDELAELKRAAIARLEGRGYQVRGKTPSQIRQMLKQRPTKSCALVEHGHGA